MLDGSHLTICNVEEAEHCMTITVGSLGGDVQQTRRFYFRRGGDESRVSVVGGIGIGEGVDVRGSSSILLTNRSNRMEVTLSASWQDAESAGIAESTIVVSPLVDKKGWWGCGTFEIKWTIVSSSRRDR